MSAVGIPIDVVIEAGVLAPQPLQSGFVRLKTGNPSHATSLPYSPNFQPMVAAAYDKSMAKPHGPVRWSLWLAAGMLFGLALGFAFGLARPRVRK
jgi:hypothetical protein